MKGASVSLLVAVMLGIAFSGAFAFSVSSLVSSDSSLPVRDIALAGDRTTCCECGGKWAIIDPADPQRRNCADSCKKSGGAYSDYNYDAKPGGLAFCGAACSNYKSECSEAGKGVCIDSKNIKICNDGYDNYYCKNVRVPCPKDTVCKDNGNGGAACVAKNGPVGIDILSDTTTQSAQETFFTAAEPDDIYNVYQTRDLATDVITQRYFVGTQS